MNFWNRLYSSRIQFSRYFAVGISGVVVDLTTLWFLIDILGFGAVFSLMINQVVVFLYAFNLNKHWAFKSTGSTKKEAKRYLLVYLFNYLFAIVWMYVWHDIYGFEPKLVRLLNIALSVSWNFLLYKYFVYSDKISGIKVKNSLN